jgi:hypothetical protein
MEPLSFKGRRGSGIAGNRTAYADESLAPRWDWQKYAYSLRVWGRLLYDPNTEADVWQRAMRSDFGPAGDDLSAALASSSRILPTITTAHAPSAGNTTYWPEVYLNHSLVDASRSGPYNDSPTPRVFGTVSPLDPQLFYRMIDFADDLLKGERNGKYTPIEVAQWIEDYASSANASLERGAAKATGKDRPEYRRLAIDVAVAADLGRFFGAKFRAGVLYSIFEKTGDRAALEQSLKSYRAARDVWAGIVERTKGVYMDDITVGETRVLRRNWAERLADIDTDIAAVEAKLESAKPAQSEGPIARAVAAALARPGKRVGTGRHSPPATFQGGRPLTLEFAADKDYAGVQLLYRQVNQADRWQTVAMQKDGRTWRGAVPAEFTQGQFPVQYYFELREGPEAAVLYPGFNEKLIGQPYFAVRKANT